MGSSPPSAPEFRTEASGGGRVNHERDEEREAGQHATVHEQADPVAEPSNDDTNEYADDRATILQPDGEPAPGPEEPSSGREDSA